MSQRGDFVIVRVDSILEDDVAQKVDSYGFDSGLCGKSFSLWRCKRANKSATAVT